MSIIDKKFFMDFLDVKPEALSQLKNIKYEDIISSIKEIMEGNGMNYLNGRFCETFINFYFSIKEPNVKIFDKHMRLHNIHEFMKSTTSDPVDTKYYYPSSKKVYLGTCKCNDILSNNGKTIPFTKTEFHAVKERSKLINIDNDFEIEYFILVNQKITNLTRIVEENTEKNKIHIILEDDNIKYSEKELKYADENNIFIEYLSDYFLKCKNILNEFGYDLNKIQDRFNMLEKCTLRPVQRFLVDNIIKDLKEIECNEVLLGAFCRIGKTISAFNVIKEYFSDNYKGKNVIFQTSYPSIFKDVIDDIYKVFNYNVINVIKDNLFNGEYDKNKLNIELISTQYTIYDKKIKSKLIDELKKCDFYVFDEAHTASGTKLQRFVKKHLPKKCKILYMTATPFTEFLKNIVYKHLFMITDRLEWVESGKDLSLDDMPLPMLIHMGFKNDKNGYRPSSCNELLSGNVTEYLVGYLNQTLRFLFNGINTKDAYDILQKIYPNNKKNHVGRIEYPENILVCVSNVKQAKYFKEVMMSENISNVYYRDVDYSVSSECDANESISKVNAFFNKKYDVHTIKFFVVVGQLGTGVTIPKCDMVWWLRDSNNGIDIMQSCSRCLNIHKNNKGQNMDFGFWLFSSPKIELKFYDSLLEYGRKLKTNKMQNEVNYFMNNFYNVSENKITHISYLDIEKQLYDYTRSVSYNANIWNNEDVWCDFINEDKMSKFGDYEIDVSLKNNTIIIETDASYESNTVLDKKISKKENDINIDDSDKFNDKELITNEYIYNKKIIILVKKNIGHKLVSLIRTKDKNKIKKFLEGNSLEKLNELFNEDFEGKNKFKYYFSEECFSQFNTFEELMNYLGNFVNLNTWEENFNRLFACILSKINNDENFDIGEIIMNNNSVKDFGEVFTPVNLVQKMLDRFPEDFWKDKNHTILDNSMGTGVFLLEAYKKFMNGLKDEIIDENERSKWIIENCLYGVEIQEKNYIIAVESVLNGYNKNKHFVLHDALVEDNDFDYWNHMQFDAIVGNPPYNDSSKGKSRLGSYPLWIRFDFKHFELLKENGYLCLVHPSLWRDPKDSKGIGKLLKSKDLIYLNMNSADEGQKVFNATTRFDYFFLINREYQGKTIINDFNGKEFEWNINTYPFIPNGCFDDFDKLIAKNEKERVEILHSYSLYETRKPWMNKEKTEEFKYPCIYYIPSEGDLNLWYSNKQDKMFNETKICFCSGVYDGKRIYPDKNGSYGLTQFCFGLKCDINEMDDIVNVLKSKKFNQIAEMTFISKTELNKNIIGLFKKNWWKENIFND